MIRTPRRWPRCRRPTRNGAHGLLFAILLTVIVALPLCYLVVAAFAGRWPFPRLLPQTLSLRGWRYVAAGFGEIGRSLAVSVFYASAVAFLSAVVCWPTARFLARNRFAGQSLLEALLLAPALIPSISYSMGLQVLFIRVGLADSIEGVILVLTLTAYPYVLRALKSGFLVCSRRYDECARNLSGGRLQRMVEVEIPLLLPSALAGMSIAFLVAFSEYFLVYLIGGGRVPGFAGFLVPFLQGSDRQVASALTLLFVAVPLALFAAQEWFLQHYYVRRGIERA